MSMRRFASRAIVIGVLASGAVAQWTDDPSLNTPVVQTAQDQDVIKLAVAPDGSSWLGWFDFQPGGIEVRVQRLDDTGAQTLAPAGLVVSSNPQNTFVVDWDLRADSDGNCMLTFTDVRAGGDFDVYAYLIAPDGTMLWGANGVTVSDNADFEADPRIIQNTEGDYLVVWPRFDSAPGLYLQRISPAGAIELTPGGVRIAGDGTTSPSFVQIEPTAKGDFVASYVHDTTNFFSDRFVDAQRYGSDGTERWASGGVTVSDATVVPIAHRPQLLESGGGAVIAWHDTRDGDFDCYVQRLDAAGVHVWPEDGVAISTEPARQQLAPAIAFEPGGDVMVYYRNMDGAQNFQSINVQRIDVSGLKALGVAGIALTPFNQQFKGGPRAASVAGGVAGVFDRQPVLGNLDGVLEMFRVDASGALLDASVIGVSTGASSRGRLSLASAGGGALISAWADDRAGNEDVFAQRINSDGTLGGTGGCSVADLAEPFGSLDFSDVVAFLTAFGSMATEADLAPPIGVFDFSDVVAFLGAFGAGCP